MLTSEERQEIAAELAHAERPRAVASDALKVVQRRRGWVSDEALRDIAEMLGMSPTALDGVATFFSGIYRRPVGRHVILLCDSVSCWVMGYATLHQHVTARLAIDWGQTTSDGRFTLLPAACLGLCEQAPALMIDADVHGHLTPEKLDDVLARYP